MDLSAGNVSTLTTDNLQLLNDVLSRHVHEQRHSQHYKKNKSNRSGAPELANTTSTISQPRASAASASNTNTNTNTGTKKVDTAESTSNNNIASNSANENPSSTTSSPELSATPTSNLSSVSSMDDLSELDKFGTQQPDIHSSSSSSLSTIIQHQPHSQSTRSATPPLARRQTQPEQEHDYEHGEEADMEDIEASTPRSFGIPLLRKKSGELIKSSLRLPELARCQSMPNAKTVRFATNLEKIKLFEKTEKPIAVSTQTSPVDDLKILNTRTSWDFASSSGSSDSDLESEDSEFEDDGHGFLTDKAKSWRFMSSNIRSSFNIDNSKMVQIMRASLDNTILRGSVFVKNVSFHKKVSIRISIDDWKSIVIIQSQYARAVNGQYDEFSFELNINSLNFKFFETKLTVNLCVEYEVNGATYWDNNNNKNYQIVLEKHHQNNSPFSKSKHSPIKHSQKKNVRDQSPPKLDYFGNGSANNAVQGVQGHDDEEDDGAGVDNVDDEDRLFNYKLKSKNKNDRYAFNFDHQYVFNDSVLSKPTFNHFEKKSATNRPHLSNAIHTHSEPNLPTLANLKLNDENTTSTVNTNNKTQLKNADEYHNLIRNYCYAFS